MNNQQVYDLAVKAINENELLTFLEGKNEYRIESNVANVPTDWSEVLSKGIYKIYSDSPERKINILFEKTLQEMSKGDLFDNYCALMIFYSHLLFESYSIAPFKVNKQLICSELSSSIEMKKEELKLCFDWTGKNKPEGIWSEVIRINTLMKEKFNISLLWNLFI